MKRLVVCCDGTWNGLSGEYPTNALKLSQIVLEVDALGVPQQVYYQEGLGTRWYDRWVGGIFGWGIDKHITEAYRFLCLNYNPGDEIYCFGFSRGAYTVRSLVGLIYCSGLLKPSNIQKIPEAYRIYRDREIKPSNDIAVAFRQEFGDRVPITVLGCWDTVGALGIPDLVPLLPIDRLANQKYQFHDTELSAIIQRAFHALAVDERRRSFIVTHMGKSDKNPGQVIREVWFPGTHGCVGGGTAANRGLSDGALQWMMEQVTESGLGLGFDPRRAKDGIALDPSIDFDTSPGIFGLVGMLDRPVEGGMETLHSSIKKRWCDRKDYRPNNLKALATELDAACPPPP
ncbi:DUF2235 domain-containing protein [Altericista sp. CCNU0014]|uniref:DUF2235 domain-containing protein n=1 Tax=Altericista sp. CCNU0014 TaxID=3082949 RepID=UPI00384B23D7